MDATKPNPVPDSQLHFLDYWRIIRIRKTVILAVFLLVVLTTTAVTFVLKPTFMSTARIEVEKQPTDFDPFLRPQVQNQFDPYFIQTEFEKIQSKPILYKVIESLGLRKTWGERLKSAVSEPEAYLLLRRNLDVRQSRNTSLIEVRAYSENRDEASAIANEVANVYKESRVEEKQRQTSAGISKLRAKLDEQAEAVAQLQDNVDQLRAELNIPDSVNDASVYQTSLEREKVSAMAQELTRAHSEYVYFLTKLEDLKKLDRTSMREAVLVTMPTEARLGELLGTLSLAQQEVARLREDFSNDYPEMKRKLALVEQIDQQVEARLTGILTGLENQVVSLKARRDELQKAVDEGKKMVVEEAKRSREYWSLKRELENKQKIRDAILMRMLQEEVDAELPKESMVRIVDPAEPALRPVRPNIPLNIALGIVVGLVMGVGLAFFIEYLDTSVKTIDDVERSLGAPVLGVIPQNVGILANEGPDSPHGEAYRVLRTNILFSRKEPGANTLTVVSGGAGEGKSTTILNLATVFAQNGQRVLVVDSDLRRPSLHKFLAVTNSIGLTNYLMKQNTLEEVIQTTKLPMMDFLASGKLPSSSLGILNSARMKEFIKDVQQRYDFVFFDSPPIMGVSDASILASEVDLSVLVVQYRKYPQAMTLRAKQMVEKVGGTMLGVVLNNINISQDSYYYYYSGYYYDYYSKGEYGESKSSEDGESRKAAPEKPAEAELKTKY
ncbi:MAG TPA: polysaccharide biosynthesis tyrosine autokinase [Verrucomicrobiota bacterium]|nr:polysaccharide biosynthesis tyrosine autokinase [Verrucomicrobiota bacterium]